MIDEGMRALAEALRQQSAAYGFVARLLRTEVDDEALGRLRAMRFPAASGNDHLDAGYRGLCAYLNAGGERQHGDLAVDFLHTFIGVTQDREQVAFPYESVYTSPEHLLMQDARDEVLAAYRAAKVVLVDEACEPEDHLAFELEFMQLLGERAAEALEEVRDFIDDALMVGVGSVSILHGKGTGALKEEIRRYLRSVPEVVSAADEHADRGGAGITVVTFDLS